MVTLLGASARVKHPGFRKVDLQLHAIKTSFRRIHVFPGKYWQLWLVVIGAQICMRRDAKQCILHEQRSSLEEPGQSRLSCACYQQARATSVTTKFVHNAMPSRSETKKNTEPSKDQRESSYCPSSDKDLLHIVLGFSC